MAFIIDSTTSPLRSSTMQAYAWAGFKVFHWPADPAQGAGHITSVRGKPARKANCTGTQSGELPSPQTSWYLHSCVYSRARNTECEERSFCFCFHRHSLAKKEVFRKYPYRAGSQVQISGSTLTHSSLECRKKRKSPDAMYVQSTGSTDLLCNPRFLHHVAPAHRKLNVLHMGRSIIFKNLNDKEWGKAECKAYVPHYVVRRLLCVGFA